MHLKLRIDQVLSLISVITRAPGRIIQVLELIAEIVVRPDGLGYLYIERESHNEHLRDSVIRISLLA